MGIKALLKNEGINVVRELNTKEVKTIAKDIAIKLCLAFPEHNLSRSELCESLSSIKMYLANLPKDFSRFERIRWPKAIILNRDDTTIKIWQDNHYAKAGEKLQISIWFNEEYLVVLEPRNDYILFITAYCTDRNHKIRALQKRFNEKCQEGYVL
jgi:hypothetical protein